VAVNCCVFVSGALLLRHAVELLQNVEAKVRLLVTLSDGKPEDYDDYKEEYAMP